MEVIPFPKYRVGDYVEWESPLGIYVGMIKSYNYKNSILTGEATWYDINQHEVKEEHILARLVREDRGNTEQ